MWNSVQCAVIGRSHTKAEIPCQDKTYSYSCNGVHIIALADGAGSAKLSHYGAEAVTKYICSELSEEFDTYFSEENGALVKQRLMNGLVNCLNELAAELECDLKDLASTLLLAAVNEKQFMIAHIGDGVIGYLKNDELKIASQPENGEFVNTTVFTTSKEALMTMKLIKGDLGEIRGFVLMSDGTEISLYHKKEKQLADVLKKIMKMSIIIPADKVQEQLQHSFETVICQATTDDCSIAILMNDRDEFKGYLGLSDDEKCDLLKLNANAKTVQKRIRRYDDILTQLQEEQTLAEVAQYIQLKPNSARRYISILRSLNLIEKRGSKYKTLLIMNK